jgi:hypothetical protein
MVLRKSRIAALEQVFDLQWSRAHAGARTSLKWRRNSAPPDRNRTPKHTEARKARVPIRIGEVNISGNKNVLIIRTPRRQNQRAKHRYFN